MYFVSIWFSFAFSLLLINLTQDTKRRFFHIPIWRRGDVLRMPLFQLPALLGTIYIYIYIDIY
jgi:hypothetical protein